MFDFVMCYFIKYLLPIKWPSQVFPLFCNLCFKLTSALTHNYIMAPRVVVTKRSSFVSRDGWGEAHERVKNNSPGISKFIEPQPLACMASMVNKGSDAKKN
jgi:hypothetical protein